MAGHRPLISIPLMVHNRRAQTLATLETIRRSAMSGHVELLLCEHGSQVDEQLDEMELTKCADVTYYERIAPEHAARNPIRRWNKLFDRCRGEMVMLTTPECLHVGDVLAALYTMRLRRRGFWRAAACWSAPRDISTALRSVIYSTYYTTDWADTLADAVGATGAMPYTWGDTERVWMNHKRYRPSFYLSAMLHREDLAHLGGFDEALSVGLGYEDVDLFNRGVRAGLTPVWLGDDQPYLVHQWHKPTYTEDEVVNGVNVGRAAEPT